MRSTQAPKRGLRIEFSAGLKGHVHASTFIRERRIVLDSALMAEPAELGRILVHELFHFIWLRLGNPQRRSFEDLLSEELSRGAKGELGWSSEWRKNALAPSDAAARTRRWREYVCESFCDTAAWLFAEIRNHDEFTLRKNCRAARRVWFRSVVDAGISI